MDFNLKGKSALVTGSTKGTGALTKENIYQMALTYLVPHSVSTYSSVKAIQKRVNTNSKICHAHTPGITIANDVED